MRGEYQLKEPVFVMGCCNSGTTILGKAIQSHWDVHGLEEEGPLTPGYPKELTHHLCPHTFRTWAHPIWSRGKSVNPGDNLAYYMTEEAMTENLASKLNDFYRPFVGNGKRLCDHSPQSTLRARALQKAFPDAYFVAIVRDAYAVSEGIRRKRWDDPDRPHMSGFNTPIETAARQWSETSKILLSYKKLLDRYLLIKYENLVSNAESILTEVLSFCKLESKGHDFPSFILDLNEKQCSSLTSLEIQIISLIAGNEIKAMGYTIRPDN